MNEVVGSSTRCSSTYTVSKKLTELTGREDVVLELTFENAFRTGSGRIDSINLDLDLDLELDGELDVELEGELETKGAKGMPPPSRLTPEGDPNDEICCCKSVGS